MELKIDVYEDRLCRKIARTATANDFELSTGICEDVLNMVNIDMFAGGVDALSDETMKNLLLVIVKDGFPFFVELVREIFELTEAEGKHLKLDDIAQVVLGIVKHAFRQLASSLGGLNAKN